MEKGTRQVALCSFSLLLCVLCVGVAGCASTGGVSNDLASPTVPLTYADVTPIQVSNPAMAKAYEGKGVRFPAKFDHVASGWGIQGLEAYYQTHVMTTMSDDSGGINLPYVIVPASDPLLPTLKTGDLLTVEAVLENKMGVYEAIIVQHLAKR